jgi:hydrogenase nickel incorporation protein HypA/HybF
MHELSVVQNIFLTIEKVALANNLKKVTKIVLKVGKLRQLVPEFLHFAFTTIAKNTIAENAVFEIELVPIKMRCNSCQRGFIVEENIYFCDKCGSSDLEMLAGKEIILDNIEGEK